MAKTDDSFDDYFPSLVLRRAHSGVDEMNRELAALIRQLELAA